MDKKAQAGKWILIVLGVIIILLIIAFSTKIIGFSLGDFCIGKGC